MTTPMQSLADFKRRAKPGAQFIRRFPGQDIKPRLVTVAHVQSNAVVFPPNGYEAIAEVLARVAENPHRHGSWFWFPKAGRCRFEDGEMIVLDSEDRPFIAFKPAPESLSGLGQICEEGGDNDSRSGHGGAHSPSKDLYAFAAQIARLTLFSESDYVAGRPEGADPEAVQADSDWLTAQDQALESLIREARRLTQIESRPPPSHS
ncbi:MAG: hypothetical protein ACLPWS_13805 [Rhodomicrobium sp.]